MIPILQLIGGMLSKVVVDNTINWCLRSVWSTIGELSVREHNLLLSTVLKCCSTEWNTSIVTFSVLSLLRCRNVFIMQ